MFSCLHFSEPGGASQYFVEQTEEELKHLSLPMEALHNFEKCSESRTANRTAILQTCHYAMLSHRCQPQYLLAVLCARKPKPSTSVSPSATTPTESSLRTTGAALTTKELESKLVIKLCTVVSCAAHPTFLISLF